MICLGQSADIEVNIAFTDAWLRNHQCSHTVAAPVGGEIPATTATAVYTASVTLTAATGYEFTGSTTATVNGNVGIVSGQTASSLTVSYTFPRTGSEPITSVAVSDIEAPVALATPDTSANVAATPSGGISSATAAVTWSPPATTFAYYTVYTASVTLTAATGYEFTGSTTATVNGNVGIVSGQTASSLTVSYTFPRTGSEPITSVAVSDIVAPVALATPDTSANVAATPSGGISSATAAVTWSPPATTFAYYTVYTASVTLTAATGYEFTGSTTATVNGNVGIVSGQTASSLTVSYTFPRTGSEPITSVAVSDIEAPVALATPDTSANVAATPSGGISSATAAVTWSPPATTFAYYTVYTASVTLTAATGYEFTGSTTATVNGNVGIVSGQTAADSLITCVSDISGFGNTGPSANVAATPQCEPDLTADPHQFVDGQ
jgi:lipocalin